MTSIITRRRLTFGAAAASTLPILGRGASAQAPLGVGFVYVGPIGDHGYTWTHNQGRLALEKEYGAKIKTSFIENVAEGPDAARAIRQLAQAGNQLIFTTSFGFMNPTIQVAKQFPKIYFEHATGYMRAENVATYDARFYEGRAVIGTIAGHMSKTGQAGYVASFPIPEVVMGIDAFCIAARKVNPNFQLKVIWLNTWFDPAKEADAARTLIAQGCDVITQHTDSPAPIQVCEEAGVICFGQASDMASFGPKMCLTSIVDSWGPHYIAATQKVLDGTWKPEQPWEGLKEGVVTLPPYNATVPADVVAAADAVKQGQIDGTLHIFTGPIMANDGSVLVEDGVTPEDGFLLSLQKYSEGVQA